jgi:glycosyltransferase involved in cell wall biosynthesis
MATPPAVKLSLCMIAKNEEQNLPRCLASVQGVVDEIILVDTGSVDQTVAVAEAHGAKVFHHVWHDDFAEARNVSLAHATGDWILHLDADEELEPESRARLRPLLSAPPADGWLVCQRNFFSERALATHGDVMSVRLFRKAPGIGYELALHEQIIPSILRQAGRILTSDLIIWHYGYMKPAVQGQDNRFQRNIRVLEQELSRQPENAFLCASLGLVYKQVGQDARADQYLRRALQSGSADLPEAMLAEVFLTRAMLARQNGDWPLAIQYAQASVPLGGAAGLNALNFLAQTHLQAGEKHLLDAQQAVQSQPAAIAESMTRLQAGQAHLGQARQAFQQADAALGQLRDHPLLNPAARGEVTAAMERCQAFLRSTAAYR